MKVADKKDVWHLVRRGILMRLHFDLEVFSLDRDFAQIASYGDALGDIAGNMVSSEELFARRPDRYLPDVTALAVTRTLPSELDEPSREPHRIVMGKIAQRFERGVEAIESLRLPEKDVRIETVTRRGKDLHRKIFDETVMEYPLKGDDGKTVHDVRWHPERRKISYRLGDDENAGGDYYVEKDAAGKESRWQFTKPRLLVRGYRIKWADFVWLRANLEKAGFHPSNIFFGYSRATITNKQREKNIAVDTYSTVLAAHVFGLQDENGVRLGAKTDHRTGRKVVSASLSNVMEANTYEANPQRGLLEGVLMPGGAQYRKPRAHRSPAYDAQADFALTDHARSRAPDIVRAMEEQADEQELRHVLDTGAPPIFGMIRNSFPPQYPLADPVTCLGFDDQLGGRRNAIMIRLDKDLSAFAYRNRKLKDMTADDMADMISEQARQPESVVNLVSLRRFPGVVPFAEAQKGMGGGRLWDAEEVDANFRYLVANPGLCETIRDAVEMVNARTGHRPDPPNPMMEEQGVRNGFGDLDYLEWEAGREKASRKGAARGVIEMLHAKASDIYNRARTMDAMLHSVAIQPHPVEWSDAPRDVANFQDLLKRRRGMLKKKDAPYKDLLADDPWVEKFIKADPLQNTARLAEEARAFRWKIARRLLADDAAARADAQSPYAQGYFDWGVMDGGKLLFAGISRDFRVVDHSGRELPLDWIRERHAENPKAVIDSLDDGKWTIQFYRLSSQPSITATLFQFADTGRLKELPARWQFEYADLRGHYLWGPPNADPSEHRWPTIPRIERDIERLEINADVRDDALARKFGLYAKGEADMHLRNDESQRIVAETRALIEKTKKDYPLDSSFRAAANFEPETGLPYDFIKHELDSRNIVVIDVPDAHLRRPLDHVAVSSPYSLVVPKIEAEEKAKIRKGAHVVLRGAQTGRRYFAGPVDILKAPANDESFHDYYRRAEAAYGDSGARFPPPAAREIIVVERLKPLARTRPRLDPAVQSVKVPSLFFDGLVSPHLSHMTGGNPLTGLVLPVDCTPQMPQKGRAVRFREMHAPLGAKLEGGNAKDTGHVYDTTLHNVRRMTVGEILQKVDGDTARRCGFADAHEMWRQVQAAFLDQHSPDPSREEIYVLKFDRVKKSSWAFFDPPAAPEAAVTWNGKPTPPSAYRPGR